MKLLGRRERVATPEVRSLPATGASAVPPPPPPPFAVAEPAGAGMGGPTGFAFPEPDPAEAMTPTRPAGDTRRIRVPSKRVLVAFAAVAVVVALVSRFTIFSSSTSVPDRAAVQATLVPLEGFEYEAAPGAVGEIETLLAGLPEVGDKMGPVEARLINRGGVTSGVVMVFAIEPDALREMDGASFHTGLQMSVGAPVVEKKRGKARTFETTVNHVYSVIFVDEDGFLFSVQSRNKRTAIDISKRLAAANL